jgi:hypothetical protein
MANFGRNVADENVEEAVGASLSMNWGAGR